jgi:amidase
MACLLVRIVLVSSLLVSACARTDNAAAPASTAQPAAPAHDVVELSAADVRQRLASGALTSRALTQAYLDRIAAIDDAGPRLHAVI